MTPDANCAVLHPGKPCYGPMGQRIMRLVGRHRGEDYFVDQSVGDYYARHNWKIDLTADAAFLYSAKELAADGFVRRPDGKWARP